MWKFFYFWWYTFTVIWNIGSPRAHAIFISFFFFDFIMDTDIEHDKGVLTFYEKNGFTPNAELYNKNRKTISMRKDLYKWKKPLC